jgi:hypothetical protein
VDAGPRNQKLKGLAIARPFLLCLFVTRLCPNDRFQRCDSSLAVESKITEISDLLAQQYVHDDRGENLMVEDSDAHLHGIIVIAPIWVRLGNGHNRSAVNGAIDHLRLFALLGS